MAGAQGKKTANITWFRKNLSDLVKNPLMQGKFVVVYNEEIVAAFDTFDAALREAVARFPSDEFAIQQVIADDEVINLIRVAL
jgi:hypothetical protein